MNYYFLFVNLVSSILVYYDVGIPDFLQSVKWLQRPTSKIPWFIYFFLYFINYFINERENLRLQFYAHVFLFGCAGNPIP